MQIIKNNMRKLKVNYFTHFGTKFANTKKDVYYIIRVI